MNSGAQLDAVPALRVEFVSDAEQLAALKPAWEALNATLSDHDAPFFQCWNWCAHVLACRQHETKSAFRPLIALVRQEQELVGIWPLSVQTGRGARIARMLDDPFGQFAGTAFKTRALLVHGVTAVLEALRREQACDGVQIENVLVDSGLHEALLKAGGRARPTNDAVYVDLSRHATIEAFREGLNKKTLKNLRNLYNRLQRTLPVEHVVVTERGPPMERVMRWTFEGRVDWLHTYARTSPAFRDGLFKSLLLTLAATQIDLAAFSLEGAGAVVAAQWGFCYLGKYYAYMSARNPEFDPFSPGRLHLGMVIDACKAARLDGLELMAPPSAYKLDWSRQTKALASFSLPFNVRGYVALELLSHRIEPAARKASRALPGWVRQPLMRLINRH